MKETLRKTTNFDVTYFNELTFTEANGFGLCKQAIVEYPNGYGASVIIGDPSYGGHIGLYEIAVLDKDGHLTYDTPITDDVIGYLTEADVSEILVKIKNL